MGSQLFSTIDDLDLNPQPDVQNYIYEILPTARSFRILELLQAKGINIREYDAISYAWGDVQDKVPILCLGKAINVTRNLHEATLQLRHPHSSRFVWADTACINQEDLDERGLQVGQMRKIYENARKVIVWLGPDENGKAEGAMHVMESFTQAFCQWCSTSVTELRDVENIRDSIPNTGAVNAPFNTAESWALVVWVASLPWFRRLWVLQEVAVNRDVVLICGTAEICWESVALALTYMLLYKLDQLLPHKSAYNAASNVYTMRNRLYHRTASPTTLLDRVRTFEASESLDRIYALVGFESFAAVRPFVQVSYHTSKLDLYRDFATIFFTQNLDFDSILCQVQHRGYFSSKFPSWVPLWDMESWTNRSNRSSRWTAGGDPTQYVASGKVQHSMLFLPGVHFDIIHHKFHLGADDWVRHDSNHLGRGHPLLKFWLEQQAGSDQYPTSESTITALAHVLTMGCTYDSDIRYTHDSEPLTANFAAFICHLFKTVNESTASYPELLEAAKEGTWFRYHDSAWRAALNRNMFSTKKGYIGIANNSFQVGDIVCVFLGCSEPYILRPTDDHYQFVAEAYVHGIMNCEVVREWEEGKLERREFEIH